MDRNDDGAVVHSLCGSLPPQLLNLVRTFIGRRNLLSTIYVETERTIKIVADQMDWQTLQQVHNETADGLVLSTADAYDLDGSSARQEEKKLLLQLKVHRDKLSHAEALTRRCVQLMLWNERQRLSSHLRNVSLHETRQTRQDATGHVNVGHDGTLNKVHDHRSDVRCLRRYNDQLQEAHLTVARLRGVQFVPSCERGKLGRLQEYEIAQLVEGAKLIVTEDVLRTFISESILVALPFMHNPRHLQEPSQDLSDLALGTSESVMPPRAPQISSARDLASSRTQICHEQGLNGKLHRYEVTRVDRLSQCSSAAQTLKPLWTIGKDAIAFAEGLAFTGDGQLAIADNAKGCVVLLDVQATTLKQVSQRKLTQVLGDWCFKPQCLAAFGNGQIALTDAQDRALKVFNDMGQCLTSLNPHNCHHPEFDFDPYGVATTSSGDFVLTHAAAHVTIHSPDGVAKVKIIKEGTFWYVAADSRGRVLVSDSRNHCINIFSSDGKFLSTFGKDGAREGRLLYPHGLCTDFMDNILIADSANHRVCRFSPDGLFIEDVLKNGEIRWPRDVTTDSQGAIGLAWENSVSLWEAVEDKPKRGITLLTTYL